MAAAAMAAVIALPTFAGESRRTERDTGSTTLRPPVPLDTKAMNAMLRADRDKDGTLSPGELEQYDMTLRPRFGRVDNDRDGKLTLYEFEVLLEDPHASTMRR